MKTFSLSFRQQDKISFDTIKDGSKAVETRAATVKYQSIAPGDVLTFVCDGKSFSKTIAKVYRWPSIDAMLKEIDFKKITPWIDSTEDVKKMYSSFPDYDEKIKEFGLIGLEFA